MSCPSSGGGSASGGGPASSLLILSLTLGASHTCALVSSGRVHCWGNGTSGRLGYGSSSDLASPGGPVPGLRGVSQISAGTAHTCALTTNGNVHCWGDGFYGQLGYGSSSNRSLPGDAIPDFTNINQVSVGGIHTCILTTNGSVHCWGDGQNGKLGYGDTSDRNSPGEAIPDLTNVTQISSGSSHTCALVENGSVHCWGAGGNSQLGYGNSNERQSPGEPIPGLTNVVHISAGNLRTCALLEGGSVSCWGAGYLGYGNTSGSSTPGGAVPGLSDVVQLSTGATYSCARVMAGNAYCWGWGNSGRLGYGNTSDRLVPGEPIPGLNNVSWIATGGANTCALAVNGSVHCWGAGGAGRLGYGNTAGRLSPGEAIPSFP